MHLYGFNVFLAQAANPAPAPAPPQPPALFQIAPFILLPVLIYFLFIRGPQQTRKRQENLIRNLKSGDKIVTAAGIVGVVITVKDQTVSIRSADAKMEITKSSVTEILEGNTTES